VLALAVVAKSRQILAWADCRRERTGRWPRVASGPVERARAVDAEMRSQLAKVQQAAATATR
jgi:hypothetical protein